MRLTIALLVLGLSQAGAQSSAADSVRRLDSLWARMYAAHDTAFAKQLYADDMIWTNSSGGLKDKRTELTDVAPAAGLVMNYFRTVGAEVRMLGADGAVVTGVAEWKFTMNGNAREIARRYTIAYGRGGPLGWHIVAVHMGQPPQPAR
jgi:ketosteroid isomerase-like protein